MASKSTLISAEVIDDKIRYMDPRFIFVNN
jgi:hypothetical protein